jgi:hypothetical protein
MRDRTREEQIMKRTAVVLGISAAFLVAPSLANGGNVTQVRSQVVDSPIVAQSNRAKVRPLPLAARGPNGQQMFRAGKWFME